MRGAIVSVVLLIFDIYLSIVGAGLEMMSGMLMQIYSGW